MEPFGVCGQGCREKNNSHQHTLLCSLRHAAVYKLCERLCDGHPCRSQRETMRFIKQHRVSRERGPRRCGWTTRFRSKVYILRNPLMLTACGLRLLIILLEEWGVCAFLWRISSECQVLRHISFEQDTAFSYLYLFSGLTWASAGGDSCSSHEASGLTARKVLCLREIFLQPNWTQLIRILA